MYDHTFFPSGSSREYRIIMDSELSRNKQWTKHRNLEPALPTKTSPNLRQMPPKADINKAGWEQSEFPILCETCQQHPAILFDFHSSQTPVSLGLGPNPFVRMVNPYFRCC